MNLQYVSNSTGQTTGVFIPIDEWNEFIKKISLQDNIDVTQMQIEESKSRIEAIKKGKLKTRSWNDAKKEIFIK